MLNGILADARRCNERDDVTGALICRADLYLQLLEGPEAAVRGAFARIVGDDRHLEPVCLVSAPVERRLFPGWAMRDDPARSWMWTQEEVAAGAVARATLDAWRIGRGRPLDAETLDALKAEGLVTPVFAARVEDLKESGPFERALSDQSSLTARSFAQPAGIIGAAATNRAEVWSASLPSFGGIGNARSLARFYDRLAAGEFFRGPWHEALTRRVSNGLDLVLQQPSAFSAGFMMDPLDVSGAKQRATFGLSGHAFGHPGAGGSLAVADPDNRIGFAYVMNRMENGVLRESRPARLVRALYGVEG
jgi:hypothetical protein